MSRPLRVGCCAELAEPGWRWIADRIPPQIAQWTFFSTAAATRLERAIRRPRLRRYRACLALARGACLGEFDLVVTHHPLITGWTEAFCRGARRCPHLAFAFNFTELPRGLRFQFLRRAFRTVERFVVFSNFERALYGSYFEIPLERIDGIHWGIRDPASRLGPPSPTSGSCRPCAVGSQGRDYATLMNAMRRIPDISLTVVATPASVRSLSIPVNVDLRLNIPRDEAERVIRDSAFLVLPLAHSGVPCGHVTMTTAMFFSKAIVATESAGTRDYLLPDQNALLIPPNDDRALSAVIARLCRDPSLAASLGRAGRAFATANCTEERIVEYVRGLLERLRSEGAL